MIKPVSICVAGLLFATSAAYAQSHLIPEDSVFSSLMDFQPGYLQIEMHVFAPAFEQDVLARVIAEPAFGDEFAVGVKKTGDTYSIFYDVAPEDLWDYSVLELMKKGEVASSKEGRSTTADEIKKLEAQLSSDPNVIKLVECELLIDASSGQNLVSIWRTLLLETHYDRQPTIGIDGAFYHFSMSSDHQQFAGKVWSPPEQSNIGRLVSIAYAIKKACPTKDHVLIDGLKQQISDLRQQLPAEPAGENRLTK